MEAETDLSDFFEESEPFFDSTNFSGGDDLFTVLQSWETCAVDYNNSVVKTPEDDGFEFQKSSSPSVFQDQSDYQSCKKRMKVSNSSAAAAAVPAERMSHITVERNRRKQMNENLSVLRSLMPCFYVKRGDQASIIGGVVDYIHELQQILHSLESKKQRKVLSPRPAPSPMSPRKPPLSPRLSVPISPRTPQPSSPYKPWMQHLNSPTAADMQASPGNSSVNSDAVMNELVATSKSAVAEVEVKFAGANLVVKTVSHRIRGQAVRIVSALEELALEILHVKISTVDQTMLYFFTIKIGIDCQLSAEELAHQIHQTFS